MTAGRSSIPEVLGLQSQMLEDPVLLQVERMEGS